MNRIVLFIFFAFTACATQNNLETENRLNVSIQTQSVEKMKLLIGVIEPTVQLMETSALLKQMLERSKATLSGFAIKIVSFEKQPTKKEMKKLFDDGYALSLFLSHNERAALIEWRIYDTHAATMIKGKRFVVKEYPKNIVAEHLADQVWPLLTGQPGFFSTRIAYCKEVRKNKKIQKSIYITAPYIDTGVVKQSFPLVQQGNVFAPRWNCDSNQPMILYSEITNCNVRLMGMSFEKKRKLITNLDGFTMGASFSPDGKKVAYCACDGTIKGKSQIYVYEFDELQQRPVLHQITQNEGHNVSPNWCTNNDLVFCSDAGSKQPYICYYHADTKQIEKITIDGYCASPSYCAAHQKIVYSRACAGVMQLFVYDLKTKQHAQITFDAGDKEESCWSPCGNYVAFAYSNGASNRIAVHHLITSERIYLTDAREQCCYPAWSPLYEKPIVL